MSFSIKFCSDLHINKYYPHFPSVKDLFDTTDPFIADLCILIGDITYYEVIKFYKKFLKYLSPYFSLIIVVPGNHEYYNNTQVKRSMKELDQISKILTNDIKNLEILNNRWIDIGDIRIFGSILWSYLPPEAPIRNIPIYNDSKDMLSREEFNMLNYSSIIALQNCIDQSIKDDKALIVATHYAPTFDMFNNPPLDPMNYWYCNDLTHLINIDNVKIWLFGHTHTPYKKEINGTIVMSNPYVNGYCKGLGININE
jgi:predicted phosphohydrolase